MCFVGPVRFQGYEDLGSLPLTKPAFDDIAIDPPINRERHPNVIAVQEYSAWKPDDHFGVNLDSTLDSGAQESKFNTGLESGDEDPVPSNPEASAGTPVETDANRASASGLVKICTCITCLEVGTYVPGYQFNSNGTRKNLTCRISHCQHVTRFFNSWKNNDASRPKHERSHFDHQGKYACAENGCHFGSKKFSDLQRHYTSKHCTNPGSKKFPCPEIGCKYSGNSGFTRKDKLKSHQKNVHEGKFKPGKPYRVIKPTASGK